MENVQPRVVLIGGTALWHEHGICEQERQDALDSIRYAHLCANHRVSSRFDDNAAWHRAYVMAYQSLDWVRVNSTHDWKVVGQAVTNVRGELFEDWLEARCIDHAVLLNGISQRLDRSAEAFRHFLAFCACDRAEHVDLCIELGVLSPGPTLDLYSLSLKAVQPLSGRSLSALVQGEVEVRAVSLSLNNAFFANRRKDLHRLIMDRAPDGRMLFDLDVAAQGGTHE